MKTLRKAAILGGIRIPFARQNTNYAEAGNIEMLSAAFKGVVERFGLRGERLGDVVAGAVLKHPWETNIAREAALNSGLAPQTPAYDVQQACATSLEAAVLVANKIALGQIEAGIAGGVDSSSNVPIALNDKLRGLILELGRARTQAQRLGAVLRFRPTWLLPSLPEVKEFRTGLTMGEHCEQMVKRWNISREAQDELALASHRNGVRAYERGFYADMLVPHAGLSRDNNLRAESSLEGLARLKPAFDKTSGRGT